MKIVSIWRDYLRRRGSREPKSLGAEMLEAALIGWTAGSIIGAVAARNIAWCGVLGAAFGALLGVALWLGTAEFPAAPVLRPAAGQGRRAAVDGRAAQTAPPRPGRQFAARHGIGRVMRRAHRRRRLSSQFWQEGVHMNRNQIEGQWRQIKGLVMERWGGLSDDHGEEVEGRREQLLGKIQKQYGITREEAEKHLADQEAKQ